MTRCAEFPTKVRYRTKHLAKQAITRMVAASNRDLIRPYRCPSCGWWHVGHKPGSGVPSRGQWGSAA